MRLKCVIGTSCANGTLNKNKIKRTSCKIVLDFCRFWLIVSSHIAHG